MGARAKERAYLEVLDELEEENEEARDCLIEQLLEYKESSQAKVNALLFKQISGIDAAIMKGLTASNLDEDEHKVLMISELNLVEVLRDGGS